MIKEQVYKKYNGKGEHNINDLELIIEQREEELHLMRSGEQTLDLPDISKQIILNGLIINYNELSKEYKQRIVACKYCSNIHNTKCNYF